MLALSSYVQALDAYDVTNDVVVHDLTTPTFSSNLCDIYLGDIALGATTRSLVAIKRLKSLDETDRRDPNGRVNELRKEVTALIRANHINVVGFYGTCVIPGAGDNEICLVTEWIDGRDVMRYLKNYPNANRLDIMSQVASGLDYLHTPINKIRPAIVHGDLHPGNVLVGFDKRVKICDFGLSKVVSLGGLTSYSQHQAIRPGRWAYLAPELHSNDVLRSWKTDVFSFAILSWELYAGHTPFEAATSGPIAAIVRLFGGERPPRAEIERTDFSEATWGIISDCWTPLPDARPTMRTVCRRIFDIDQ